MVHMFGLLVEPIAAEFDASVTAIGAGMSIFVLSMAIATAFVGPFLDRGIVRPTMLAGIVAMVAGMTWAARGNSLSALADSELSRLHSFGMASQSHSCNLVALCG